MIMESQANSPKHLYRGKPLNRFYALFVHVNYNAYVMHICNIKRGQEILKEGIGGVGGPLGGAEVIQIQYSYMKFSKS